MGERSEVRELLTLRMRLGRPLIPPASASAFFAAASSAALAFASAIAFCKEKEYSAAQLCSNAGIGWQREREQRHGEEVSPMPQTHDLAPLREEHFLAPPLSPHLRLEPGLPHFLPQPGGLLGVLPHVDVVKGVALINRPELREQIEQI